MNVDGEYFRLNNPKEIILKLANSPLGGRVRIAMKNTINE